ncbi:MAG TPA: homoserine dehydrogenase [Candidatus Binataceae bacterium]|nr:homoserine dehydrogenase [Candidatus Binataceae bacterium]
MRAEASNRSGQGDARAKPLRIGLLGCGTVGTGVVKLLRANASALTRRIGAALELAAVADRSLKPDPSLGLTAKLITKDSAALAEREDLDIIVELFGGEEPARSLIIKALANGKDVVTANKALLATHGEQIFRAADRAGRAVGFEASVGGGIPIIRTLRESLAGDRQRAVYGIVNGTCNYILTTMSERGTEFAEVLAEAQRTGLAEADPALDIDGHDAAHKLCLLAALAFGVIVKPAQIYTEGIGAITQQDIAYARELGFTIKLLAIAKDENDGIEARVQPTMIPRRHLLAEVGGAFNAIYIQGEALGSTLYFGRGAGEMPTATAVMADIVEIARNRIAAGGARSHPLGLPIDEIKRGRVKPMDDVVCEYYLRFMAPDKPGVLGVIASVLGRHGISIASVIQQERNAEVTVPVVMRTHEARERNLKRALAQIRQSRVVKQAPVFIRIEERL